MHLRFGLCIAVLSLSGGAAGAATLNGFGVISLIQTGREAALSFDGRLALGGATVDAATGQVVWTIPQSAISRLRVATVGAATLTIDPGDGEAVHTAEGQILLDVGGLRVEHGLGAEGPPVFGSLYRALGFDRLHPDVGGAIDARLWRDGALGKGAACGYPSGGAACVTYRIGGFTIEDVSPDEFVVVTIRQIVGGVDARDGDNDQGPPMDFMPAPLPNWLIGAPIFGFTADTVPDFEGRTAIFSTEVAFSYETAVVPLPPALPLLIVGLASLIAVRRRAA